jgi:hypothetical protein
VSGTITGIVPDVTLFNTGERSRTIILPTTGTYTVTLQSTGEPIALEVALGTGSVTSRAITYQDLLLPATTSMQLVVTAQDIDQLRADQDGDGVYEGVVTPTRDVTGALAQDRDPPQITVSPVLLPTGDYQISLTAQDASGIALLRSSLDGTDFISYTAPLIVDPAQTPLIYAFADDQAGNRSGLFIYDVTQLQSAATAYGLAFDGVDDDVRGPTIPLTGPLTIEAWVRPTTNAQDAILLTSITGALPSGWCLSLEDGYVKWWALVDDTWVAATNWATPLQADQWYHVAVVYDGADATVFINGQPNAATTIGAVTHGAELHVGGLAGYHYFTGQLDEVRLSRGERYTALFTPPTVPFAVDQATVALYHLDDGAGQSVRDSSPNAYHLTLGATPAVESTDARWIAVTPAE